MATQTVRATSSRERAAYLQSFVDCEHGVAGAATDADGDGYNWCDECDDSNGRPCTRAPRRSAATASTTTATASSTTAAETPPARYGNIAGWNRSARSFAPATVGRTGRPKISSTDLVNELWV